LNETRLNETRLNETRLTLLAADRHSLSLPKDVLVDVHLVAEWSSRLVAGTATGVDMGVPLLAVNACDLLPGWSDDWVLLERERLRQRVLHALEALSRSHSRAQCHAQAVDAAMAAVAVEPLRESAQRTLIEAHLAEGNCVEARRCYEAYRELAYRELGVGPSADLRAVVGHNRERTWGVKLKRRTRFDQADGAHGVRFEPLSRAWRLS
jgi:two-component SAPR family response regulator